MTRSLCMFSEEDRQFLTIQVCRLKFIHKINKNKMDSFPFLSKPGYQVWINFRRISHLPSKISAQEREIERRLGSSSSSAGRGPLSLSTPPRSPIRDSFCKY